MVSTGVPGTTPREFVTFEPEAQQHDDAESMLVRNSTGSSSGSMLPISSAGFKDSNSSVYSASAKSHGPNEDDALQLLATLSDADFRECSSKCVDTFDRMYRLLHEDTVGDAAAGARQAFSEESGLSNLAQMIFSAGDSQKLADDLVASIAHLLGLSCKRCEASKDQMRETGLLAWLVKVVAESSDEQTELKRKAWCAVWYSSIGNAANEEAVCADGILRKLLQNLEDDHILCGCVNLLEAFCGHSEGHRKQISQCPETLPLLAVLAAENRPNDGPIKAQAILRLCGYHDAHFPDLRRQGWALVRPEMVSLLSTVAISHGQEGLDKISKLLRPNASGDKPSAVSRAAFRDKAPCSRPCCLGTRTTASCCHRRDTHIACARNRNRPSRAIRISGFGRSGATSVGRSSVQRRPPVGHKAPCSRPCCLGTRLASPSCALACTGGMACHRCTPPAPPLCALASSPAARAGGVLLSSWLLGRKASLLAASS